MLLCACSGDFAASASCDSLSPGSSVKFEVELQATSCANGGTSETVEIYPIGLTESLKITAEVDCSCVCSDRVSAQNTLLLLLLP